MQPSDPKQIQTKGTLMITQERVVEDILFTIKTDGLEEAIQLFETLNKFFSIERGWPETALEIRTLFADLRKKEVEASLAEKEAEQRLKELKATSPKTVILNTNNNKNSGKTEIDSIDKMDVGIYSPGNNIAKSITLEKTDKEDEN